MPLIIKSQPRNVTTATDDMAGKIKANIPARIIRPLCTMYQNECRFIFSRMASRITWEAASTDIDGVDMRVAVGEGATVLISSDKGLAVYWAEVQLGGHELVVNLYAGRQSEEGRMTYWRMAVIAVLVLLSSEVAAQSNLVAKCNAQFRKCNSHCNLVYERGSAHRACRDRCKDTLYVCKAKPR